MKFLYMAQSLRPLWSLRGMGLSHPSGYLGFLATGWQCPLGLTIPGEVHFCGLWEYELEFFHSHSFSRKSGISWLALWEQLRIETLVPLGASASGRCFFPSALCITMPCWNPSFQLRPFVLFFEAPKELGKLCAC